MSSRVIKRRRRKTNPNAVMSLAEHLAELRTRLLICLFWIILATVLGIMWFTHNISFNAWSYRISIPSAGELLRQPYCALPASARADITHDGSCRLLSTGPFDQFMLRIKVGLVIGLVASCPIWLYQIWQFITPGLKKNERRYTLGFVISSSVLFIAGSLLAYFLVTPAFHFLLTVGSSTQVTALAGDRYFSFMINLLIIFGFSFELPIVLVALNFVGILPFSRIKSWQRGIIFGLFVFAAVVTPGQDPFSMLGLAIALTILFEIALVICYLHDAVKKKRNVDDFSDLPDDQASPLSRVEAIEIPAALNVPSAVGIPSSESNYDDTI